jgi:CxxC motif-containing protein
MEEDFAVEKDKEKRESNKRGSSKGDSGRKVSNMKQSNKRESNKRKEGYQEEKEKLTKKKKITCIVCPTGCSLEISYRNGKVVNVSGYTCKRGMSYGWGEATNPVRVLTTTVRLKGGKLPVLPVKSDKPLLKDLLFECMKALNATELEAPVALGDIVAENIIGSGINIIATRSISAASTRNMNAAATKSINVAATRNICT